MSESAPPNQPLDPAVVDAATEVEGYGLFDLGGTPNASAPSIVPDAAKSKVHVSDIQISKLTDSSTGKLMKE